VGFRVLAEQADFDAAGFTRIYEESFPASERTPTDEILAGITHGSRVCLLAETDDVTIGFAIVLPLQRVHVHYLEYFAVESNLRDRGIGTRLLQGLVQHLVSADSASRGLVLEVEPPQHATGAERALRTRRLDFYLRSHVTVVSGAPAYRAPSFTGTGTLPFLLMWLGLNGGPASLEGPLLRHCVSAILVEGYGLASDNPLVGDVVTGLTS